MRQSTPLIASIALTFALATGGFVSFSATPAQAGYNKGGGGGCGGGCNPPPPPPPDCGCEGDDKPGKPGKPGGKVDIDVNVDIDNSVKNSNNNYNYNDNSNSNNNYNYNDNSNSNNVDNSIDNSVNNSVNNSNNNSNNVDNSVNNSVDNSVTNNVTNNNDNSNSNNNSNNVTNTNSNNNSNNVNSNNTTTVNNNITNNVNSSSVSQASAVANAVNNANVAANAAARATGRGGSALSAGNGIGNGNGSGGGGGSYYIAPAQPAPMGALNVVVRSAQVMKPVKAICVSPKGLEEAARISAPGREIGPGEDAELFHCVAGDMLVVTIGQMAGRGHSKRPDYTGGYVIECRDGESLHHGSNGLLACVPGQSRYSRHADLAGGGRHGYSELFIRKSERGEQVVSVGGGAYYNGGVGY